MPRLIRSDYLNLATYLRQLSEDLRYQAHLAAAANNAAEATRILAEIEALDHWAGGLEHEAPRKPDYWDEPAAPVIEGLTDGLVHRVPDNFPSEEAQFS
jgi:hypothetical protein